MPEAANDDYKFWAFISYSSRDAEVAKKLHRALETYRIPRDLRGRPGRDGAVPDKLFPVFRDRDELPLASDLGTTITDALRASRYLIVLCSPNAAASRWVDEEVRTFKKMGREDRILALILAGEPNGASIPGKEHLECFPPCLKTHIDADGNPTGKPVEPIGGDLRKGGDGWNVAFLKAVAGITGLGFNAFARREQKRKRVKQAIAAGIALAVAGAGLWTWDYTRVKTKLYEHFVLRHGVPQGFGEVSKDQFKKRYFTYRIEESRRKVRKISAINRYGTLGAFSSVDAAYIDGAEFGYPRFAAAVVVKYREDGGVAAHEIYDVTDRAILRHIYSADGKTIELRNPGRDSAQTMAADSASLSRRGSGSALGGFETNKGKTEIARWRVKLDDRGYVMEKSYGNAWGDPTADRDGKAVVRYTRDAMGNVTGETALGLDGETIEETGTTVASTRLDYDNHGRLAFYRFLDISGNATVGPQGYAVEEMHHDDAGNVFERRFLGKANQLVMRLDGFSIFRGSYDANGLLLSKRFYDTQGKPVVVPGFGYHELRYEHDKAGRESGGSGFGVNGEPLQMAEGYHRVHYVFDDASRLTESTLFGLNNEPVRDPKEFWHRCEMKYDSRGNMIDQSYFGTDGKPVANSEGVSRTVWTFDDADRSLSWRCYGEDRQACLDKNGIHETRFSYDGRGNITRWANFGTDRKPILCQAGDHIQTQSYDERGNVTEVAHLGVNGEPVVGKESRIYRTTYAYNSKGQEVERRFFDASNARAHDLTDGQHLVRYTYDALGNIASESFFGSDDKPVNRRSDSIHRFERESDIHGKVLSEIYFNHEGKKALNSEGYHKLVQEFDDRGNEITEAYFGIDGEPVDRAAMAVQKISRTYDEHGWQTSESYTNAAGNPALKKDFRYVKWTQEFNDRGQVVTKTFYDAKDHPVENSSTEPYARERMAYDDRGNVTETAYFDTELKPMTMEDGFHKWVDIYDGMGNLLQSDYFDTEGKPVDSTNGYFRYKASYDARGHLTERSFFGVNGEPAMNHTLVAHRVTRVTDDRGNVLEEAYFDTGGKPVLGSGRIHKIVQKFDEANRELEERYFGIEGEPILADDSNAHVTACKYDEFGQVIERTWFGAHDEPVNQPQGYHREVMEYDASGNTKATFYFGADGKPAAEEKTGVPRVLRKYNTRNQLAEVWYEDALGKPMTAKEGYARQTAKYDQRGNVTEICYFGADGKPVLYDGGARWTRSYDPLTNETLETIIYDLNGDPVTQ